MTSPRPSKDKFFEKVINPYLSEVMKHPQAIEMSNGVLHIRDVQGLKKEGSEKARLAALEEEIFKCQGMVEHGVSANHSMITDLIRENKLDTKSMGEFDEEITEINEDEEEDGEEEDDDDEEEWSNDEEEDDDSTDDDNNGNDEKPTVSSKKRYIQQQ
ncbi:40S ribosomal protein S5-1 [Hordeum vulgare]|nr:40S ribosomal protein S5-1 [Hordeum vulgare]